MHYRMTLNNLKELTERLTGYVREGYNRRTGEYEVLKITADWLLTLIDGNGWPTIVLDEGAIYYNDECIGLIKQMLVNKFGWGKSDGVINKCLSMTMRNYAAMN